MKAVQQFRLPVGGRVDRSRPLRFVWAGRTLHGYAGDTLASALVANGVRLIGRSFKLHRPRGLMGAGVEECNALVQLGEGARSTPNVRATEVPLYEGLVAGPVNCWPSARFDLLAVNKLLSWFLPAGFYYKTFKWPHWHLFEGAIRHAAGLGKVAQSADPDRYESRSAHCDVLVVGAGPAGLAAARAAAATGARVMLVEQDIETGGQLLTDEAIIDGLRGIDWVASTLAGIVAQPEARVLLRTAAIGYHDHNLVSLVEQVGNEAECAADPSLPRARTWLVRAGRVVLATGAIERPLVFPGNDRPGIMLASASRHYVRRHAALPGRRAVIYTNNDEAYRTAVALADAGVEVAAVVDARTGGAPSYAPVLAARGIRTIPEGAITATRGSHALRAVRVCDSEGQSAWMACDHLAVSGGKNPTVHLFSQSGGSLRFDEEIASFVPATSLQKACSVGAAAGAFGIADALQQGHAAGVAAAAVTGFAAAALAEPSTAAMPPPTTMVPVWHVDGTAWSGKAFVDFQNDVTVDDIALSARENYRSVEHLKRYTTLGMAPDQGKTANVNALAIMAAMTGQGIEQTGHTRYRYPFTPVALGTMAGRNRGQLFRPLRRMPAHQRHDALNAQFEDFGGFARPAAYPRGIEAMHEAEQREARAVRDAAGLFEASPLGKIEVVGRDAGRFLDFIYANTMSTLKPGKVRYGLMLSELGVVLDDGVATRLGDDQFLIYTSSGGADRIASWLEEWLQCEWTGLDVIVAPVTSAWGVLTLTGPRARDILSAVGTSVDLGAFPHMSFAEGIVAGLPARLLRVSYTGETSYEINVSTTDVEELWDRLMLAGVPHGLTPVGIEAWMILRTEKGYLHIGADTDGSTSAVDVGWGHVLKREVDFIGKRSLMRPADRAADRLQFVGLAGDPGMAMLPIGGHVLGGDAAGRVSDGYVTSSVDSPGLGRPVALGMVRGGRARIGERVDIVGGDGRKHAATIVAPTFYDPDGDRLRG